MSFSGLLFLVLFLPAALALYWLVPRTARAQNAVLLLTSYAFIYSWGPKAFLVFLLTTAVNYALLSAARKRDEDSEPVHGRWILLVGVAYNLGQLLALKYAGFFADTVANLARVFGPGIDVPALSWVLPIGISFWTLQLTAYLVDVAYGRRVAPRNLLDFATFAAFFPQIVSGPIARGDLIDQMERPRSVAVTDFSRGAFEFGLGYVMKYLVASTLADVVNPVYADPGQYGLAAHWLALVSFAFQVFCDFAGYSLMALGLARFFGLQLIENFRYPFLARNISDFWKRWHISLTNLLFDYIYTPLVTGNGWMRGRLAAGLFVVLVVSGLWHGATWMFVLWGALHGAALAIAHRWDTFYRGLCRQDRVWVTRRKSATYAAVGWVLTQGWFLLSLIPFRAPDMNVATRFAAGLLGGGGTATIAVPSIATVFNLILCLLFVPLYHWAASEPGRQTFAWLARSPAALRGCAYGFVLVYLFLFQPVSDGAFLYAQF